MLTHAIDFNVPYFSNRLRLILWSFDVDTNALEDSQVSEEIIKRIVDMMENMDLPIALKDIVHGSNQNFWNPVKLC